MSEDESTVFPSPWLPIIFFEAPTIEVFALRLFPSPARIKDSAALVMFPCPPNENFPCLVTVFGASLARGSTVVNVSHTIFQEIPAAPPLFF